MFALVLVLSLTFVSAGIFSDFIQKRSGKTVNINSGKLNTGSLPGMEFFGPNNRYTYFECIDTENPSEPNPTLKGSIYVEYSDNGGPRQNITIEDSCGGGATISSIKSINEYWCKNWEEKKQPVLSVLTCDIGKTCEEGACVGGLECNETDGGKDYPNYGEVSGYDPFEHAYVNYDDVCLNDDEIHEAYCDDLTGEARREYVLCANGCAERVCIEPAENGNAFDCVDEDGGIDASVTGTVTEPSYALQDGSFTDLCTTEVVMGQTINVVVEGYCSSSGKINTIWVDCPGDCIDGSCVPATAVSVCVDTDEGKVYDELGTVTGDHYGIGNWSLTDSCHKTYNWQQDYLREGYCDENGEAKYVNVLCEGDCLGGTCDVGDAGIGGNNNINYSVSNPQYNPDVVVGEDPVTDNTSPGCIDSDEGDYYLKGTRTIGSLQSVDTCTDRAGAPDLYEGEFVFEFSCKAEGEEIYLCPNGCVDGACVKSDDSSNGAKENIFQKIGNFFKRIF